MSPAVARCVFLVAAISATPVAISAETGDIRSRESALAAGLQWLAAHQSPDGSWSYDTGADRQAGDPADRPTRQSKITPTAMALLSFLGAGHTHTTGHYKSTVKRGLSYLISRGKPDAGRSDLGKLEGDMFAHGVATLALCEAYAMTREKRLRRPAQSAVNLIVQRQDEQTGGWAPQTGGTPSTLTTAWQITALKSAHMAYLDVPQTTVQRAIAFLDRVQTDGGARYRRTSADQAQADNTSTAAGLFCRMYLGWNRNNPALVKGVAGLGRQGPPKTDSLQCYFATHVMRLFTDEHWQPWNDAVTDWLVESQAGTGKAAGSWFHPDDATADLRCRLMHTALSLMILEVRYATPIRPPSVQDEFPL